MKKHKRIWAILFMAIIIPCITLLTACGFDTTYISPTVTVDKIVTSDIQTAINRAALSVVSIYTEGTQTSGFWSQTTTSYSAGAGIIYKLDKEKGDAYIITNYHVVYDEDYTSPNKIATTIKAELYGSEGTRTSTGTSGNTVLTYGAQAINCIYIGGALNYDIAVLKITNSSILKNSYAREVEVQSVAAHLGQVAIAIGNPLGIGISATKGIVSVESEYIQYSDFHDVVVRCIRTDASINGGNSGGGLFDETGKLLGIVNAGMSNAEGIAMAIPTNLAINVADNVIYGYENSKWTGVKKYNLGIEFGYANNKAIYDEETGLTCLKEDIIISSVSGVAENLEIAEGDKVTSVKLGDYNLKLSREFELDEFFLKIRPGDTFQITTINSSGDHTYTVTAATSDFKKIT